MTLFSLSQNPGVDDQTEKNEESEKQEEQQLWPLLPNLFKAFYKATPIHEQDNLHLSKGKGRCEV
jgi:hypothetical protein